MRRSKRSRRSVKGGINNAITLVEKVVMDDTKPRYNVLLNGKVFSELYFNLKGYVGYLPIPPTGEKQTPGNLNLGEVGISKYKSEIRKLNKEWANWYQSLAR